MKRVCLLLSVLLLLGAAPSPAVQDGVHWVPTLPSQYQGWFSLGLFDDGTGFAHRGNSMDSGPLFRTRDFGESWEVATVPPSRSTATMVFATPSRLYTVGFGGDTFVSEDAGDSWTEISLPIADGSSLGASEAVDADTLAIGVEASVEPEPGASCPFTPSEDTVDLLISRDRGATWESRDVQERPGTVGAIALVPADDPADERLALITSDTAWEQSGECSFDGSTGAGDRIVLWDHEQGRFVEFADCQASPCRDLTWLGDVLVVLEVGGDVVRYSQAGEELSRTSLDGAVATALGEDIAQPANAIEFADDQVGYASLNGGGVWRTDDGGVTWVNEVSPQEVIGVGIGSVAVADTEHALSGGPTTVNRRLPEGIGS